MDGDLLLLGEFILLLGRPAHCVRITLEKVWLRVQAFQVNTPTKLVLSAKQEFLLKLLCDHGSMSPAGLWDAMGLSKQGTINLLNPLLDAGLVERIGSRKTGRYALKKP